MAFINLTTTLQSQPTFLASGFQMQSLSWCQLHWPGCQSAILLTAVGTASKANLANCGAGLCSGYLLKKESHCQGISRAASLSTAGGHGKLKAILEPMRRQWSDCLVQSGPNWLISALKTTSSLALLPCSSGWGALPPLFFEPTKTIRLFHLPLRLCPLSKRHFPPWRASVGLHPAPRQLWRDPQADGPPVPRGLPISPGAFIWFRMARAGQTSWRRPCGISWVPSSSIPFLETPFWVAWVY